MELLQKLSKHEQILVFKGAAAKKSQLREVGHFLERQGLKKHFFNCKCGRQLPQK